MKNRIIALIIDYFIILLITTLPFQIAIILQSNKITNLSMNIYLLAIFILFLFKDTVYKNASIGKKLLGLEIKNNEDNIPKKSSLILRNIFLPLWPIEIFLLFKTNKRIGDMIFKTNVIIKNHE